MGVVRSPVPRMVWRMSRAERKRLEAGLSMASVSALSSVAACPVAGLTLEAGLAGIQSVILDWLAWRRCLGWDGVTLSSVEVAGVVRELHSHWAIVLRHLVHVKAAA